MNNKQTSTTINMDDPQQSYCVINKDFSNAEILHIRWVHGIPLVVGRSANSEQNEN